MALKNPKVGMKVRITNLLHSHANGQMKEAFRNNLTLTIMAISTDSNERVYCHHPSFSSYSSFEPKPKDTWNFHLNDLEQAFVLEQEMVTALENGEINDEIFLEGLKHIIGN